MTAKPDPPPPQGDPSDADALLAYHVVRDAAVDPKKGRHVGTRPGVKGGTSEPGGPFPGAPRHRRE